MFLIIIKQNQNKKKGDNMSVGRNKDGVIYFLTYYQDHTGKRKQKKVEQRMENFKQAEREAEEFSFCHVKRKTI